MIWLDGELEIGPTLPAAPPPAPRRIAGNELETLRRPTLWGSGSTGGVSRGEQTTSVHSQIFLSQHT